MHADCKQGRLPKTNTEYWKAKLEKNVENDNKHNQQLREMGWNPITIWECELKADFEGTMKKLISQLQIQGLL